MGIGYYTSLQIECFKCRKVLTDVLASETYSIGHAMSSILYFCTECFEDMCPAPLIDELKKQKEEISKKWDLNPLFNFTGSLPYSQNPIPYHPNGGGSSGQGITVTGGTSGKISWLGSGGTAGGSVTATYCTRCGTLKIGGECSCKEDSNG